MDILRYPRLWMVNKMAKKSGHLISFNGEYLYSAAHGGVYSPLRVNERALQKIQTTLQKQTPPAKSCIKTIAGIWCDGQFMLATEFNSAVKCDTGLANPSKAAQSEKCLRKLCNGQCTDTFMRNVVAKNILPELYNTKQK